MNFTLEIKNEIIKNGFENACCKAAALAAFIRLCGSIKFIGGKLTFEAITESENVAEYFVNLLEELYGAEIVFTQAKLDNLSKRDKITFECRGDNAINILTELGIIENTVDGITLNIKIDKYILENECCKQSFIKGAFLGGGNCTIPTLENHNGYHLEFVFSNYTTAESFLNLLKEKEINAKITSRKDIFIVYLKSSEDISDLLALMEASNAVLKINDIVVKKSRSNDINRVVNCEMGNLMKQYDASVKQIQAINDLQKSNVLKSLSEVLYQTAITRLENKDLNLNELAEKLKISKSCLNHRLRKLIEISKRRGKND
jgi:hypothetical protein